MKPYFLFLVAAAFLFSVSALQAQDQKINKKNLVIKEWKTDVKSNARILDHVTTYNADGKKVEEIEYNSDGQKWRKRYEYDAAGKVVREMVYNERNKLDHIKKYEYNEFGRKKTQYTYNPKGKLTAVKQFEYLTED